MAAESASPAEMVRTPSILLSCSNVALIASATAVASPKLVAGSGSCFASAAGLGDAVDDALAARLLIGGARNGIDADDVLFALFREIFAAGDAGNIFVGADIIDRAEFLGLFVPTGIHENNFDAGIDGFPDRRVLAFRNPVRNDETIDLLADGGLDQLHHIGREIVIGLQTQVIDLAAIRLDHEACVVDTLFDEVPERIVVLAADNGDIGRERAGCHHERDSAHCEKFPEKCHCFLPAHSPDGP